MHAWVCMCVSAWKKFWKNPKTDSNGELRRVVEGKGGKRISGQERRLPLITQYTVGSSCFFVCLFLVKLYLCITCNFLKLICVELKY